VEPNFTRTTGGRVEIERSGDTYEVSVTGGPIYEAGIINIGGRSSALNDGATLELGGGDGTIIIKGYDDGRSADSHLIAIGFEAEAVL